MFTGIIQAVGTVRSRAETGGDVRLEIGPGLLDMSDVGLGDSIAVSGVCLTVVGMEGGGFAADVSRETLSRTSLGELDAGGDVNLEKALQLSDRLGGHLVSGHVDGIGKVIERRDDARSVRFDIEAPAELAKYIAEKGSVCVDGVSLTVNGVAGRMFHVNIVPHTLEQTTLVNFAPGRVVNLEVDLIARYLERLVQA